MKIIETKVFTFDELGDAAKEKARDWYRQGGFDYDWWEHVYEQAAEIGKTMGWNIKKIYFSGFSSQGDGACFEGSWSGAAVVTGGVQKDYPDDNRLNTIAKEFERLSKLGLSCTVKQSGHYMHENCTAFDISIPDDIESGPQVEALEDEMKKASRDFMCWIYRQLEKEYDWMNADEQIDDNILANEYTFTVDGKRL